MLSFFSASCAAAGTAAQRAKARARVRAKLIRSPLYQEVKQLAGAARLRLTSVHFPTRESTRETSCFLDRARALRCARSAPGGPGDRPCHLRLRQQRRLAVPGEACGDAQG